MPCKKSRRKAARIRKEAVSNSTKSIEAKNNQTPAAVSNSTKSTEAKNNQTPAAESNSTKSTWENFVAFVQNAIQKISFIKEFFSSVYNYFTRKSNAGTADSQANIPAPAAGFASKSSSRATSEHANKAAPTNSIANSIANFFASMRGLLGGKAETPNPSA